MLLENQITLAMMITGILRDRNGQLRKIANAVQYTGKKESLIDRFRRFVRNPNLRWKWNMLLLGRGSSKRLVRGQPC
jgi:hypothetical protein